MAIVVGILQARDHRLPGSDSFRQLRLGKPGLCPGIINELRDSGIDARLLSKLSRQELLAFRDWFSGFDAAAWDKQFEEDAAAGHFDALADEAIRDLREGRCWDL